MKYLIVFLVSLGILIAFTPSLADAHQSGCHRWHSCPSDSGSYTCGDTGYCSQCPDNKYCKGGQPYTSYTPPKYEPPKEPVKVPPKTETKQSNNSKCTGTALCITDKVTRIVDGDTLSIKKQLIRLSLVNSPERNHIGFVEAKTFTGNLCPVGSIITIDQDDKQPYDKYKRMVGKVFCGDKNLNSELLENNHAKILKLYCKTSEFSTDAWAKKYGC